MNKADKISLGYILTTAGIGLGCLIYSAIVIRKEEAAQQLEIHARNYANAEVLRLFLENKIRSKEDMEREFQFAYMNYRAHH